MTMYAYTATSFRSITSADQAAAGETVGETVPQATLDTIKSADDKTNANRAALQQQSQQAFATIDAFLALAAPTNAQTLAQVQFQARAIKRIARLVIGVLDTTN